MPKITIEIIDIIVLFGAGQGLILAFILVSTKRLRKMSNFFLAILLFTLALLTFTNTFETNYYRDIFPDFQYIPSFWLTLIPTSVYFYILAFFDTFCHRVRTSCIQVYLLQNCSTLYT